MLRPLKLKLALNKIGRHTFIKPCSLPWHELRCRINTGGQSTVIRVGQVTVFDIPSMPEVLAAEPKLQAQQHRVLSASERNKSFKQL